MYVPPKIYVPYKLLAMHVCHSERQQGQDRASGISHIYRLVGDREPRRQPPRRKEEIQEKRTWSSREEKISRRKRGPLCEMLLGGGTCCGHTWPKWPALPAGWSWKPDGRMLEGRPFWRGAWLSAGKQEGGRRWKRLERVGRRPAGEKRIPQGKGCQASQGRREPAAEPRTFLPDAGGNAGRVSEGKPPFSSLPILSQLQGTGIG